MAGNQTTNGQDLQRLVRTIVVDLMTDQESPVHRENSNVTASSNNRFTNVNEELNTVFHIPRGPATSSSRSSPSTNDTSANVAVGFNPQQNYGRGEIRRQRNYRTSTIHPPRKRQRGISTTTTNEKYEKYIKDVILLPGPSWCTVPRREKKTFLQVNKLVIDAVLIDKRWDLAELKSHFSQLFSSALVDVYTNSSIEFEFVKSAGTSIVPINMQQGQELNGKILKHIVATGPVYLRALQEINLEERDSYDDTSPDISCWFEPADEAKNLPTNPPLSDSFEDSTKPTTSLEVLSKPANILEVTSNSALTTQSTSNSKAGPNYEMLEALKQIFVGRDLEELAKAAQKHENLQDAINDILDTAFDESSLSETSDFHEEDMVLSSPKNASLALNSYRLQMEESGTQVIPIDRHSPSFLRDIIRIYKRPGFSFKRTPEIDFTNEMGIDAGGLTKEFFHLALTKMRSGDPHSGISLFEGETDHIVPIHCSSSLDSGLFHLFGKMLAHSILHGGMGFIGMAPAVAKYITTKSIDDCATLVCLEDIPDLEYRDYVNRILKACDLDKFAELNEDPAVLGLLDSAGFVGQILNKENAHVAAQQIMMHEVIHKRRAEMMDISSGMETLSLVKLLSICPDVINMVFPTSKCCIIDPSLLKSMIKVDQSTYRGVLQNENALTWLHMYIDDCAKEKSRVSLNDLCMFVTGKPQIGEIDVQFHNDMSKKMPKASTCPCVLTLPVCHQTYNDFKKQMDNALLYECVGFHLV